MTRAEEIAAALERWETWLKPLRPDVAFAGNELARLLRESQPEPNPPTNSESSTEAATWKRINRTASDTAHYSIFACKGNGMDALRQLFPSGKADELNMVMFSTSGVHGSYGTIEDVNLDDEDEPNDVTFLVVHPRIVCLRYGNATPKTADDVAWLKALRASSLRALSGIGMPEPAAPAVGEDAGADCECTCASELAEKVRVLLAEVARLTEERDRARLQARSFRQSSHDHNVNFRTADVKRLEMRAERDKALATLADVRRIAENYHDVDVVGDPPREVACNPCANDILNVLEGRKP